MGLAYWIRYGWSIHVLIERKWKGSGLYSGNETEGSISPLDPSPTQVHNTFSNKIWTIGKYGVMKGEEVFPIKRNSAHPTPPSPLPTLLPPPPLPPTAGYTHRIDSYGFFFFSKSDRCFSKGKVLSSRIVYGLEKAKENVA